jgi:Flp pilus assembly protein TadG
VKRKFQGSFFKTNNDSLGVSLVEFALVVPLLLAIFFGTFDLGFAAYANNTVSLSAREGARKGIACSNCDAVIRQRVKDTSAGLNLQDGDILISPHTDSGVPYLTVTVNYTYTPLTPFVSRLLSGGSLTLTGKATMYDE